MDGSIWLDLADHSELSRNFVRRDERETLQHKRVCRTFSDCTTAPRNGLPSGCYPLDPITRIRTWRAAQRPKSAWPGMTKRRMTTGPPNRDDETALPDDGDFDRRCKGSPRRCCPMTRTADRGRGLPAPSGGDAPCGTDQRGQHGHRLRQLSERSRTARCVGLDPRRWANSVPFVAGALSNARRETVALYRGQMEA